MHLSSTRLATSAALLFAAAVLFILMPCAAFANQDFIQWLSKHGIHEIVERELAQGEQTPEIVLERAKLLLDSGQPKEAYTILRDAAPFADASQERARLLLFAVAARRAGSLSEAVFAWSLALGASPNEADAENLRQEPGFPDAFEDVWRQWYWQYTRMADRDLAFAVLTRLNAALTTGLAVWPASPFWDAAAAALRESRDVPRLLDHQPALGARLSDEDRKKFSVFLGYAALGRLREARAALSPMSNPAVQGFFTDLADSLLAKAPRFQTPVYAQTGYPKARAFADGIAAGLGPYDPDAWQVREPQLVNWAEIRGRLAVATPEQAVGIIERELAKAGLDPLTTERLRHLAAAQALTAEDAERAAAHLAEVNPKRLPLSLKLHLSFATKQHPRALFDQNAEDSGLLELSCWIAAAAGYSALGRETLPFWSSLAPDDIELESASHPLDQALLLAGFDSAFARAPSAGLARRVGYLFPLSTTGAAALVLLANEAGSTGAVEAAATYLGRLDPGKLHGPVRLDWLKAKGALEIELGLEREALATYSTLYREDRARLLPLQRLKLALLAQRMGNHGFAREVLGELWSHKGALTEAEQAETLFWLAESAEAMGEDDEALHAYLRVAWGYPSQNIWAVTAMYRAALILENSGRGEAARGLLKIVIANSDRASQKEQAEQRLKQIEERGRAAARSGARNGQKKTEVLF